ncbi:hypothetical protein BH10CYA1_BH10CYA1_36720 [soil metagenome]
MYCRAPNIMETPGGPSLLIQLINRGMGVYHQVYEASY